NPKGRIIRVPDTYDPETRTYSGTWEGVFKWAWTDNPAWIYYDIILNERFGLGQRIDATQIDKWELYRIAQYCDQQVPDGKGGSGTEPRFRCNVYIQDRNDAWTVLRDLAGIFRGMTYWGDNKMYVLADMPRDVWHIYNHASVVEGKFTFADPSETTRNTAALVNWSDPANHYKDTPEPVYDNDLAMRFDYRQLEMTAIGCTRQSEANRRGRWALLTNGIGEVVTFSTGMDVPPVGEVIGVAANELAGRTIGGRVSAVNGRNITLDRAADVKAGNRLFLNLPSGTAQARTVQAVNGNTVTVTTPYSETPEAECNWGVDSDDLFIALFRVTGTRDNNDGTFEVTGTTYNPDIYSAVDTGARLDERPVSVIPPGVQAPPGNIVVDSYSTVNQNIAITTMRVAWDAVQGAVAYEAEWRRDSGNWISVPRTSSLGFEVQGIYSGRYLVRVRAVNASDVSSVWATSSEVNLTGKVGNPPKPVGFIASDNVVFGIELNWGFPANTDDTLKTEIQYSLTGTEDDAMLLADVPYPQRKYQQMGLKAGQIFWYRAQLVDRTGNESGYTGWVRGQASIDVSDITDVILEDIKGSETFKDLIENAVDTNEKIAGMANDILQANNELEQQALKIAQNAQDIGQVQTDVKELTSNVGDVSSSLSQLEQTVATADTALGQRIDNISVSMDGMAGGVKNSAIAIIQNGLAQVAARKTLSASVAGNSAQLDRLDEVIVSEKEATARSLMSLQTDVNGNKASINSLNQTFSDYQQATATQINGITATVNGHTSAITTNAQAIANVNGGLSAMYNIKVAVDANGRQYAAGMGIGVENTPGGMQSQVLVLADRFAVMTQAGGAVTLPFVIQNGQVFINDAFFRDASIQFGKITDSLRSDNFVSGSAGAGWNLPKSGNAELNNVTIRGMVYASGGSFKGTVEATSFVGDVANVGVGSDASLSGTANLVKTITYTDSGSSSLAKNALVEATFYSSANADTSMNVTIDINGTSKTFSNLLVQSGAHANNFYTLRFGVKGINTNTVKATLTIVNANSVSKIIYSPSLMITRGAGSFVG
ncbi:host specificity protein J, partial [Enterobacter cloacae]